MTKAIKKDRPLVFIVEDNAAYRILLGKVLEKRGFLVMMFEHGRKAVDMLHHVQPNLILSDITMPCMDGFELHNYVIEKFGSVKIPFVYLSSNTTKEYVNRATKLGASRMLGKPIEPEALVNTIDLVLSEAV